MGRLGLVIVKNLSCRNGGIKRGCGITGSIRIVLRRRAMVLFGRRGIDGRGGVESGRELWAVVRVEDEVVGNGELLWGLGEHIAGWCAKEKAWRRFVVVLRAL